MNRIFNMDNGFFRGINKLVDCIWLSFIFLLTCIPIFTIGASLTALYYTVQKSLKHDRGYIGGEYWHAFKTNFKQSTLIWLIALAVGLLFSFDADIMKAMDQAGKPLGKAYIFFQVLLMLEALWCSYIFAYIARFENTSRAIVKNAALMAILNLPRTLVIMVYLLAAGMVLYVMPITVMLVPAVLTWMMNLTLEKVFRKYMTDEDREAEDEMNREYKN